MSGDRPGPSDDAALVVEVAAGSEAALEVLYDRHADAIYAAACRLTSDRQVAEEVVQETFLALWNRAELFDRHTGSLAAWLHAIARNRTVDRLRAAGRRPALVPFSSTGAGVDPDPGAVDRLVANGAVLGGADLGRGPEAELEALEVRSIIGSALGSMPEAERVVIVLAYQDDLTQAEIANRLGWPLGTVKTRTRRALHRLRDALAGEFAPRFGVAARAGAADTDGSERDDDGPR
jgi:RNA polymerase sigma-70 factor (ECF subfamily)